VTKAVFTHKPNSIYDDLPEERYHFPSTYIRQVENAIGDFIVYYEPGRIGLTERNRRGRRAYVATARVTEVRPDPAKPDHFYAVIDPSSYVGFDRPVPFREGSHYYEEQLKRDDGATSKGAFGRAFRPVSEREYEAILRAGFARELDGPRVAPVLQPVGAGPRLELLEDSAEYDRPVIERVMSRPVRDAAFAHAVRDAYGATCAMTGLKIINGGGRAEVQAAHIRPVSERGPDSIRNGVALSATVHWMFDRGLVSIGPPPDYPILVAKAAVPDGALRLFRPERRLALPDDQRTWPAPSYLDYHRSHIFKG
jgi:putative restriction endonuclease